ncbi:uncharacterized protein [Diadema antillarum]|uniref:uncharacterized protein n=1 Tax=Diadema antillarum TaxID=105358 RepID=UPI003A876DDA
MEPCFANHNFNQYDSLLIGRGIIGPEVGMSCDDGASLSRGDNVVDFRTSESIIGNGDDARASSPSSSDEDQKTPPITVGIALVVVGAWRPRSSGMSSDVNATQIDVASGYTSQDGTQSHADDHQPIIDAGDDDSLEKPRSSEEEFKRSWCSIGVDFMAILFLSLATAMLCADGYVYLSELWGRSSELLFLFSYVTYLIQVLVIPAYSLATRLRAVFVKPSVASRCPLDPEFVYRRVSIIHSFHKTSLKPHFMLLFNVWPLVHAVLRCAESKIINHKCHIAFYVFSDVSACVGFIMYGSFWYIMYLHRVSLYYELKRVARVTQGLSVDERVDDARRYICRVHQDYLVLREMMGVWMAFTMVTATWGIMSRLSWDYAIAAQDTSLWSDKHRIYMDVVVWSEKAMFLTFPYFALGGVNLEYLWQRFRHALERRRSYQHRSFWNAIQMHTMYINNVGSRELRWTLLFALIGPYLAIQSKWNEDQNLEFWNGPFNCSGNYTHT